MFDWFRCRQRGCLLFKYNSTFDIVDEIWVTQVEKDYPEADTFYHIPKGFELVKERSGNPFLYSIDEGYSFQKWVKV